MTTSSQPASRALGGRYEVVAPIGDGAAAQVYRVRDLLSATEYAAKVLRTGSAESETTLARFEDEYRILRATHHPGLPEVFDYGHDGEGSRYMIMELVDGVPLDTYLAAHPQDLWVILYQLCEVVSFIHDHNLLHLDIKPSNLLVRRTQAFGDELPLVTLLDFGLTHQRERSAKSAMVGTPSYMAPEVIRGKELTRATDHYSLGVMLYELLVGEVPFKGTAKEVFAAHLNEMPRIENEQIEYTELYPHIYGLMAKDPRERLEAFEALRRTANGRMTGGIDAFARAVGIGHIESLGLFPRDEGWTPEEWENAVLKEGASRDDAVVHLLVGPPGSGKTYILDRTVAEWKIQGRRVFALGEDAERWGVSPLKLVAETAGDYGRTETEDFDRAWLTMASDAPCAVVADDVSDLPVLDTRFLQYVATRLELERASDEAPDVRIAVSSDVPESPIDVRSELVKDTHVLESSKTHAAALCAMVGKTVHREDARRLEALLGSCLPDHGLVMTALQQNITSGGMRYLGGAWQAGDLVIDEDARSRHRSAIDIRRLDLPSRAIEIAEWISCDEDGLPVNVLKECLGIAESDFAASLHVLARRRMIVRKRVRGVERTTLRPSLLRGAVYGAIPPDRRRQMHQTLIETLQDVDAVSEIDRLYQLVSHQRAIGSLRTMCRTLLRVISYHQLHREWGELREAATYGLEALGSNKGHRLLARRFLKTRVNLEYEVGIRAAVVDIVDRYVDVFGDDVVLSLVVPYAAALIRQTEFERLSQTLDELERKSERLSGEPRGRLSLCRAMYWRDMGQFDRAQKAILTADKYANRFSAGTRALCAVTKATIAKHSGEQDRLDDVIDAAVAVTRAVGDADGLIVSLSERINTLMDRAKYSSARAALVEAMRAARRAKLFTREYDLRFKSSFIYHEEGDYRRSLRHMERAASIAVSMGDRSRWAEAHTRVGMNHQALGRYGNALRYGLSAERMSDGAFPTVRWTTKLFVWDVLIHAWSEGRHQRAKALQTEMRGVSAYAAAYFEFLRGLYEASVERYREAMDILDHAADLYEKVGARDDAARAALRVAQAATRCRDFRRYEEATNVAMRYLKGMESHNLRAETAATKLEGTVVFAEAPCVDHGELEASMALAKLAGDVAVRLRLCRAIYHASAHVDALIAQRAFAEYYELLRIVLSGLGAGLRVDEFLNGGGHASTIEAHKQWLASNSSS